MKSKLLRLFQPTNSDKPLGGRYKVISQLASGGFGQTFLAEDMHLPGFPRCVVKQLKPQVSDAESLQTARRLFDTEARVLYQLGNHDQIPRLLAHFEDNREFYLAQELIEGEPLTQELVLGQPWSETQVVALLQDLLYVLAFVHQQQVIHRDIKPSNLMRRRGDGKIVLIDFGAVKQVSTQLINPKAGQTNLTISIGTQGYMPKEQLGGNPRFSSDVYAVGVIGIQALTGIHPRFLKENPDTGEIDWYSHAKHVSPELAAFLDQMVRYDFRVRYRTAADALEALKRLSAVGESQPLPQLMSEVSQTEEQQFSSTTETRVGIGIPSINTPSAPPHSAGSYTGPTEVAAAQLLPPQPSGSSAPTVISPDANPGKFTKPWQILVGLTAVGAAFLLTKPLLFASPADQTADRGSAPVASPAAQPTSSPSAEQSTVLSPTSSPASSPTASPSAEQSTVLSPTSSPAASPTASPSAEKPTLISPANPSAEKPTVTTNKPVPPIPANPAPATQASPAPVPTPVTAVPPPESQVTEQLSQANKLRQAQQSQQALKLYDKVLAAKPDVAEAHWGRCYSLNALQQPGKALAACNEALALNPNYPEALWSKGSALEQQQRYQEALKLYEQATTLKPDFAEAWNNRGTALYHLDRSAEAVAAYQEAIHFKPDFSDAWANRGAALWNLRRFDEAKASVNKALEIQPNNQNAQNLRQQMQ